MTVSQIERPDISWEEDFEHRVNPILMTRLLHEAIPVLKSVDWKVTEVGEGLCRSTLPLCHASTNQHGTHQAALISLSADYTGGLALATLLRGVPLAGVHRCRDENSASLWLAAMDVKYRSPSTGHLTATCIVSAETQKLVRDRYFAGKRVLVTLPVIFTSNDEVVAEAEMKYFAQPSVQLKPTKEQPKVSPLFKHKLKASARMIAGLRAAAEDAVVRLDRAHEREAAGPHGELLAKRLHGILPQLKDMVLARTSHIDRTLEQIPNLQQVVILGAGLDMRPFRLFNRLGRPLFFELDLPEMLEERSRVISQMEHRPVVSRRMVAADFKVDDVSELLLNHPDFNLALPTAIIYEGCSMYFSAEENQAILRSAARWMQHPDSRLWCDVVTENVVRGTANHPAINQFLAGMEELGERFIFGHDQPALWMAACGLPQVDTVTAGEFLGSSDAAMSTYQFVIAHR